MVLPSLWNIDQIMDFLDGLIRQNVTLNLSPISDTSPEPTLMWKSGCDTSSGNTFQIKARCCNIVQLRSLTQNTRNIAPYTSQTRSSSEEVLDAVYIKGYSGHRLMGGCKAAQRMMIKFLVKPSKGHKVPGGIEDLVVRSLGRG